MSFGDDSGRQGSGQKGFLGNLMALPGMRDTLSFAGLGGQIGANASTPAKPTPSLTSAPPPQSVDTPGRHKSLLGN